MAQQQPAAGPGSCRAEDDPQTESHDQAITQTFENTKRNESINGLITVSVVYIFTLPTTTHSTSYIYL
jgi:hypothetical protein